MIYDNVVMSIKRPTHITSCSALALSDMGVITSIASITMLFELFGLHSQAKLKALLNNELSICYYY